MTRRKVGLLVAAVGLVAVTTAAAALAGNGENGFKTDVDEMLDGRNGWTTEAIISVGDTLPGGYTFEAIPDGIAVERINGQGTADILVNHELSLVPFPATRQDHINSTVSKLRLHQNGGGVLKGEYVIPQSAGYQRFCSNFLVGPEHGFERELLLTNEEGRDIVLRAEDSWEPGLTLATPNTEQAGVVVAYDVKSGAFKSIYGMGRHNHENAVAIPGYGHPVVLSGDDTFDAPASQLYLYNAASGDDVWNDNGKLYAFVSDTATINDYGDVTEAMPPVAGHFIEVPPAIATGKINGREVTSADFGYPAPPSTAIPNGPQWVLEHWSNLMNVFQFIRVEDMAYNRTSPRTVYLADTGEPRAVPSGTRLGRGRSRDERPVPERADLRAEARSQSARGRDARHSSGCELRRGRIRQRECRAPARQRRDDERRALHPGGHGRSQLVQPSDGLPRLPGRDQCARLAVRPHHPSADGRGGGQPGDPGRSHAREGHLGVQRYRRCIGRLRARRVPRGHPGSQLGHGDPGRERPAGGAEP